MNKKTFFMIFAICVLFATSSCTMLPMLPAGPAPGTVGFYDLKGSTNEVRSEDVRIRRMSTAGDIVFVYRVNDDRISLGYGKEGSDASVKHIDEASKGVIITTDSARRLAAYLQRIIAQYDTRDKRDSLYMDFRILTTGVIETKDVATPSENIAVRFQYSFNEGGGEEAEVTNFYLGSSVKKITYNDLKILISNLQKN